MNRYLFFVLLSLVHCVPAHCDDELFVRRIEPLLREKCVACHGGDPQNVQGGLNLLSRPAMLHGGDSSQAILDLEQPDASPLLLAVLRNHDQWSPMPPKQAEQLSAQQVAWLREWIATGASWPSDERMAELRSKNSLRWQTEDGVNVATSAGLSKSWNDKRYALDGLWAYQPLQKPAVASSGSDAIDELLLRGLPKDTPIASQATATEFIRRATYDLTGLPPSPVEIESFTSAYERNADWAVQQLVERLLASPHYGEHMAQHWLDVVRYADSSGFSNDYERGTAWRYRDYVVRAFNQDKPYDQFIQEQIAGDEIDESNPEMLVATGFLRMGPWELTGMEVARIARQRFLDDVTNIVGETFLAHPLQCARCHDHKFDPIPTRDYYALQATFAATQLVDRPAEFLPAENQSGFEEARYLLQTQAEHQATLQRLDDKSLAAAESWFKDKQLDNSLWQAALAKAKEQGQPKRRGWFGAARAILLRDGVPEDQYPPRMLGWTPTEIGLERIANKGLERIAWQLERYEPIAMSVANGPTPEVTAVTAPMRLAQLKKNKKEPDPSHILLGGDPFSLGDKVMPGVLSVLASAKAPSENVRTAWSHALPESIQGRRLALAKWISHSENPLTPRVIVNRLWLWHFDQALAGNPNNFGATGKRPSHPELLDWLAATLMENRWSIKAMQRLIMNSAAYRRSTSINVDSHQRQALEQQLAVFKPRRLTAEELRDSMLAITGELNRTLGGIPNRPEINAEVALQPRQVMGTFAAAWVPNPKPAQRHRRALYALKLRGLVDPDLEVFNAPAADFSCERREVSTITTQAFTLMNGQFTQQRSVALADKLIKLNLSDEATIEQLWLAVLGRAPQPSEKKLGLQHWQSAAAREEPIKSVKDSVPTTIERAAVEENTGERFTYTETLYSNADFVPDLRWSDVSARTRGLAHVALVLFNSNEFAYVY